MAAKENCRCCDVVRGCESGATVERSETGVANNVCPCGANNRKSGFAKQTGGVLDAPPLSLIAPLRQKVRRHRGQDRGHDTRNRNRKPAHGAFDLAHL